MEVKRGKIRMWSDQPPEEVVAVAGPYDQYDSAASRATVDDLTSGLQRVSLNGRQPLQQNQQNHQPRRSVTPVKVAHRPSSQQQRQFYRELTFPAGMEGWLIGKGGEQKRRLQTASGVSRLYIHKSSDQTAFRVEISGAESAVEACVRMIHEVLGTVSPILPPGLQSTSSSSSSSSTSTHLAAPGSTRHPDSSSRGWPSIALPLKVHQRWTCMFPYLQRRSCVRITADHPSGQLFITGQSKSGVEEAQQALERLSSAEAFVVVNFADGSSKEGSPFAATSDLGFPITKAQGDEMVAELEDLPEIEDYRGGVVRKLKGARERDCVSVTIGSGGKRFLSLKLKRRDAESTGRLLEPLLRGEQPVEGWGRWLMGGFGWEFAKSDMAARGKWTAKLQECRDMLVAANKMAGGERLQGLLYYKDPATGGMVQRLRGSGGRYEEVITDVRKFLEFLIFSSAYRKKSGLPGNDYMWDAIERICLRTSYLDTRVYNGGLMRTSARGPDVPCQWSAHAHESTHPFCMVTEATQSELLQGVQRISRLLIEEAAGLRYREVEQVVSDSKDSHTLEHLKPGDLVEVGSGKLKGSRFVFVEWTTAQQLSAKLREVGEGGEVLGRSVNRTQLISVAAE